MSSSDNNITFKKTSFLSGINSEFINQLYSDYLSDRNSLPEGWQKFFDGLSDDEKLILSDLNGPSWSPEKKIKIFKPIVSPDKIDDKQNEELKLDSIKVASKDSVRAIMLIRAYRIRGHLIANLDPLSIQKICDEVIFLINGKIEWHGSVKEMSNSKHIMLRDYLNSNR